MLNIIENIPDIKLYPLEYVFEVTKLQHKPDTLWLEFGVATGKTINYISKFTKDHVYGFDSFDGLPEDWRPGFNKGRFTNNGLLPVVNDNVVLVKGLFCDTLPEFLEKQNKKITFIHIDCDLYSSTKYVLTHIKKYLDNECIIIFDELVNYDGFDNDKGELKALYEFLSNGDIKYEWIGMNGKPYDNHWYKHQSVAIKIFHSKYYIRDCLKYGPFDLVETGTVFEKDKEYLKKMRNEANEFMNTEIKNYHNSFILEIGPTDFESCKLLQVNNNKVDTVDIIQNNKTTFVADLTKVNQLPKEYYDVVVCIFVIEHCEDPINLLKEINKLLKKDGILYLATPFQFRIHGPLPDNWRISECGLKKIITESQYSIKIFTALMESERPACPLHYLLKCKKL